MNNDSRNILPGCRVMVFDTSLYVDDIKTPPSMTIRKATVIRRYGYKFIYLGNISYDDFGGKFGEPEEWLYPDCVDVVFDWSQKESKGHFTTGIQMEI